MMTSHSKKKSTNTTKKITIRGARTHNLKRIDLEIPRDQFVVITGISGSGKSSLAFDTLYAEGQRRYVESLSAYARQFLSLMEKPDVEHIEGLSPAIAIEQKATSHNPRSTVGTITEIYDYLRVLFARVGEARCPQHHLTLSAQSISQMVDQIQNVALQQKIMILAPLVKARKGEHLDVFQQIRNQGFVRLRVNGELLTIDNLPALSPKKKHTIEVVVDRLTVNLDSAQRLAESLATALQLSDHLVYVAFIDEPNREHLIFSSQFACPHCAYSVQALEPRLFSFNNPLGACKTCNGLGVKQFFDTSRILEDPKLSLLAGAIRGWDKRNAYYFSMLESLAKHYKFDLETPFEKLPAKIQDILWHGSQQEMIDFYYFSANGSVYQRRHAFVGIIPSLEKRYKDTESSTMREDLAKYLSTSPCDTCSGGRLCEAARHVFINAMSLPALTELSIQQALVFIKNLQLEGYRKEVAEKLQKELSDRLTFLINVGLDYLSLSRGADTLSGGEAQRIRLASQIGAGLVGVMYVLDEPSIGLHQRDNQRLLEALFNLRDLGNSVIVVEHDEDAIRQADYVIDIGPGAGKHGGEVIATGTAQAIMRQSLSLTGQYLAGTKKIAIPEKRHPIDKMRQIRLYGASGNNLKNIDLKIPVGLFTCVTGVSGSGKSTLINDTLYPIAARYLNRANSLTAAPYKKITGLDYFDKVIDIDQSPIGRTPRSNPATYTGIFTPIRELFTATIEARSRGYKVGRFSFNVKGGRCETCQGDGLIKVEMHFLSDIYVTCDLCKGKRYNRETLEIFYKGKTIHDVLEMSVEEAATFFAHVPSILKRLKTLMDVGLAYLKLGQSATTLSGGEAQRVKLAKELSRADTGNTLYILDEPTTGLHFHDIAQLLCVLQTLRDRGNTIIVIEHNLDVIKTADWLIDLGPEGGKNGGTILVEGPPEVVAASTVSYTGQFLAKLLKHRADARKK